MFVCIVLDNISGFDGVLGKCWQEIKNHQSESQHKLTASSTVKILNERGHTALVSQLTL